ncbi:MAG TPA: peptidylprolyl isomerase [Candidatus Sulfotelmatobacter sp.]|nr:peptidylprolyl isomerase [Candidatus Sulfotelmatobacter sp.]
MKRQLSILILLLPITVSSAWAQLVSSHSNGAPAATTPAATASAPSTGKPVLRINGAVLTDIDLLREEYAIFPYAKQHNGIPKAMESDIRAGALKMLEFEELVYQEALRRKLTVAPERLQRAEVDFRKQFQNPQDYEYLLKNEFKGSKALLRTKIVRSLLIEEMLKTEVEGKSYVSIPQARAYYDKNVDHFRVPESYAVQTISIIPPPNAPASVSKEARKKADDALRQAKQTKSYDEFGLLAERISEDDYRVMMGDHKAVDKAKLPPEVLNAVVNLQPGQMSDLVDIGNNSYTIIRLNAHTPAGVKQFAEVKDALRTQMKKQKAEDLRVALDKRLRKNAKIEEL